MPAPQPRLLITATINRPDIVAMFAGLRGLARLSFVEYDDNWGVPLDPSLYASYGSITTWAQHRSADALLDAERPALVVMLAIASREQVALRLAARERGIEVIHLEHGYRLPLAMIEARETERGDSPRVIGRGLSRHKFFLRSLAERPVEHRLALAAYALTSVRGLNSRGLSRHAAIRRPDRYVSFAPECFTFHSELDRASAELASRTIYVGVPQFDCFVVGHATIDRNAVALIDHQLHNARILGWTAAYHREWAATLFEAVCVRAGKTLHVKEHPGDTSRSWAPFVGRGVELIGSVVDLALALRSIRTVLGVASTLQIPAAALEHTALITLEMHPDAGELSSRFVEAGVAEPVRSPEALVLALNEIDKIHSRQVSAKPAFTGQFLHRLDGHSAPRLAAALLDPGAPLPLTVR